MTSLKKTLIAILFVSLIFIVIGCPGQSHSSTHNKKFTNKPVTSTLLVDASSIKGPFKNIAGGVNASIKTKKIDLQNFSSKIGLDFFRIKLWTWRINTSLDNFLKSKGVDRANKLKIASDTIHKRGGKVMIQFYGVPKWLSTCNRYKWNIYCNRFISNAIPEYSKYPPSDYDKWQKLVRTIIKKLNKYIKIDYIEVYGEPNIGSTWYQAGTDFQTRVSTFLTHYEKTAQAIRDVDPDVKIGGPAFAFSWQGKLLNLSKNEPYNWSYWVKNSIKHIKKNNVPFDFMSWHAYNPRVEILRHNAEDLRNYLNRQGFSDIPLFLTEWGVDGGKNLRNKIKTHFGASFATAALMEMSNSPIDAQHYYDLGPGPFGLVARDHKPRATFNAFTLFSMLKGDEIEVKNTDPVYMIRPQKIQFEQQDIKAVATRDSDNISLLATYYVPIKPEADPKYNLRKEINILIKNIPFEKYTYKIYLIDKDHSNVFSGSGPELEIFEEGENSGTFEKQMNLPIYGTVMVRISSLRTMSADRTIKH